MSNAPSVVLFHCPHFTVRARGPASAFPFEMEYASRRVSTGGFCYATRGALRKSVEDNDGVCDCLRAWAQSDACWYCGDGTPVEAHEGKPACEACARALREGGPGLCARCHDEPRLSTDEELGAQCFEDELRLRALSASLDLIADAKALGISPRSVLQTARKHADEARARGVRRVG